MKIKTGIGFDVHRLAEGETLWIGGILIPHTKGLVAHSDGDVLIHAIADALLGAAGLRDIGFHFPDTDATYKNADSKVLLKKVADLVAEKGFTISNIDAIICAQQPKFKNYIPTMQTTLASVLGLDIEDVNIKATTTEQLGFEGREEGISAYSSVLIFK